METVGSSSLSSKAISITEVPNLTLVGLLNETVKFSLSSSSESSRVTTLMVFIDSPAAKVMLLLCCLSIT